MNYLLPHRFKKIGLVMTPLGLVLWLTMQLGYLQLLLNTVFGEPANYIGSLYHVSNIIAAVTGFFSFLAGIYFVAFSKEKVEDEMVQRVRFDSFHFAAFIQSLVTVAGFLSMLFWGDPGESGMMLFFIGLVFLFWLTFVARFNYILHVKYRP